MHRALPEILPSSTFIILKGEMEGNGVQKIEFQHFVASVVIIPAGAVGCSDLCMRALASF
jgi:hypothetical protein